jgi:hypothetical protein
MSEVSYQRAASRLLDPLLGMESCPVFPAFSLRWQISGLNFRRLGLITELQTLYGAKIRVIETARNISGGHSFVARSATQTCFGFSANQQSRPAKTSMTSRRR